ncbi:PD-(D/E)XK nuclease family protein [Botrimarina mediterranea]|uniref:ATP-dependent helicase/deoxyribonuclease subunit B n=1 Tax=Botrimarina mediterranea TaxID=2528022 RepID=A0A518K5P8_9BACT|nr:PD-(D/E)XK nuclease family protein [Botrimarina mediterranea]QDV73123.1 ATP-dependent helicase/deoxyribonuclease subunit B [Botrimarina mediterranea]QDV77676.1 ATP-dependent helicase/deoxyribonuclease subunit B [Planctomycetes bacterium K2D]
MEAVAGAPDRTAPLWWIAASPAAAATIRRDSIAAGGGGWLAVSVLTLRQAADRLTRLTPRLTLSPAAHQALVAEIASTAKHKQALGPLEPLIDSPGLVTFLSSRFRDLRRKGLGPQEASGALRKSDGEEAGGVLARLYRDYTAALDRDNLADDEEAILVATQQADRTNTPRRLVIDLPLALTPIEEGLIAAILANVDEATIAIAGPDEDDPAESQLPAAKRLRERWEKLLPAIELHQAVEADPIPPGLAHVRRHLFDDNAPQLPTSVGVAIVSGGSAHDTARRVARRVKLLLTSGVRPSDIVLAAPSIDAAAPRYVEALREYGVPVAVDASPRLETAGVISAIRAVLDLVESNWRYDALLAVLSRSDFTKLADRGAAEWFVREQQIPSGGPYLLQQARHLAELDTTNASLRLIESVRKAKLALGVLETIEAACDKLAGDATPLAWLDAIDAALRALGHAGIGASANPDDRRAGDVLEEAAAAIESLAHWRQREPRKLQRREWNALVRAWAGRLRLPTQGAAEGRVRLVGTTTAIGLPCAHLLVVEAGESAFASPDAEGADEAMLHFYELCATPSQSLTFAYPALDSAAQPLMASPYVTDVERLFEPNALRAGQRPLLTAIDHEAAPASLRELRIQAALQAVEGDTKSLAAYGAVRGPALLDGLRSVDARARGDDFGPWEGVFASDAAALQLADRFGPGHPWSASRLELMATCPFKFFARHVLNMEPVGELALGVDYRRRGMVMHDALAECLTELVKELADGQSLRSIPAEALTAKLVQRIEAQVTSGKLPAHEAALARIEARQATTWAQSYAQQQAKYETDKRWSEAGVALKPALLEVRFGKSSGDDGVEDEHSVNDLFEFKLPGGEVLLISGRIDRIDTAKFGDYVLFTVVDYKTSKSYSVKVENINSGKQLQPVLYALAAQKLLLGEKSIPVGAGYWALQSRGFVAPPANQLPLVVFEDGEARASDEWLGTVETVRARCETLVRDVRDGKFPMNNDDEHCGRSCEFRTICRVAQARSVGKVVTVSDEANADNVEAAG